MTKADRSQAATDRAVRIAQDRHRRIENARVACEERQIVARMVSDIEQMLAHEVAR